MQQIQNRQNQGFKGATLRTLSQIPSLADLLLNESGFKAVCFDMDGTLLNSEPLHAQAVWRMLPQRPVVVGENSFDNEEQLNHFFCGQSDSDVFKALYPGQPSWNHWQLSDFSQVKNSNLIVGSDIEKDPTRKKHLDRALLPKMLELLKELKKAGIKCALVSASQAEVVDDFVKALNLEEYFDTWIGADSNGLTKPHPDPYLKAAQVLGLNPQECLALEDSSTGIHSAQTAGMKVIRANWF